MDSIFYTLQDFMTYTKGLTYVLMFVSLCFITAYFSFLTERDSD